MNIRKILSRNIIIFLFSQRYTSVHVRRVLAAAILLCTAQRRGDAVDKKKMSLVIRNHFFSVKKNPQILKLQT